MYMFTSNTRVHIYIQSPYFIYVGPQMQVIPHRHPVIPHKRPVIPLKRPVIPL